MIKKYKGVYLVQTSGDIKVHDKTNDGESFTIKQPKESDTDIYYLECDNVKVSFSDVFKVIQVCEKVNNEFNFKKL